MNCPICDKENTREIEFWKNSGFNVCNKCDYFFYTGVNTLTPVENHYADDYWQSEIDAAKERAWGIGLARASEVFLLSRRIISSFLDIGAGPGYFLDSIEYYLPKSKVAFYGVEKYPPAQEFRTQNIGYKIGWLDQFEDGSIDAGVCIEVLEHLTAGEVKSLFEDLYLKASDRALFLFNTGLTEYVKNDDHDYLDPEIRGHISIWSVKAIQRLIGNAGWRIREIPNRSWCFVAEKTNDSDDDLVSRIWNPHPSNILSIEGSLRSKVLFLLGRDGLRAR